MNSFPPNQIVKAMASLTIKEKKSVYVSPKENIKIDLDAIMQEISEMFNSPK